MFAIAEFDGDRILWATTLNGPQAHRLVVVCAAGVDVLHILPFHVRPSAPLDVAIHEDEVIALIVPGIVVVIRWIPVLRLRATIQHARMRADDPADVALVPDGTRTG